MAIGIDGFDIYTKFHAKNYDGPTGIKKKLETLEKKIAELDGKTITIKFKLDTSSLSAVKRALKSAFNDIDIDLTGAVKRGVKKSRAEGSGDVPATYPNYEIRAYKEKESGWTRRNTDYPFEDFKGYYLGYTAGSPSRIYEGMRRSGYTEADFSNVWEGDTDYFDTRGNSARIAGLIGRNSTADATYTDFADINFFNEQMFRAWRYANTKGGTAIVPVSGVRDESSVYFNDETVDKYSDLWRRKFGYREQEQEEASPSFSFGMLKKPMIWTALAIKGMEKLIKFVNTMSKDGLQIAQGAEALNTSASTVMGLTMAGKSMGIQNMQGSLTALQSTITGGKWGNFNSDMYRYLALLGLSYEDTVELGATGTFNKVIENARLAVKSGALTQEDARYFVEQILGSSGTQMFDTFSKLGVTNLEEYRLKVGGIVTLSEEATSNLSEFSTTFSAFNQNLKTALQEGIGNSTLMKNITDSLSLVNKGLEVFSATLEKEGLLRALGNMGKAMNEKKKEDMEKLLTENEGFYINFFGKDIFLNEGGFFQELGRLQREWFGIATGGPNVNQTVDNRSPVINIYVESGGASGADSYAYGYGLGEGIMDRLAFGESGGFF